MEAGRQQASIHQPIMRHDRDRSSHILSPVALLFMLFVHLAVSSELSQSDGKHDILTVCDGEDASFSWPCDLQYDLAKTMTLTFNGLNTQRESVATITSDGDVTVSEAYSDRVRARGTSGVHVDNIGILDSGAYVTTVEFHNGTTVERQFTLSVLVPPLLTKNALTVSVMNASEGCQSASCGHIIFPGFPSVSFVWNTPDGSQTRAAADGWSVLQGCPLLPGSYTCRLSGPALRCGGRRKVSDAAVVFASVQTSEEAIREAAAKAAEKERHELLLMILVPIIVLMVPLVTLGLWVLKHVLADYPSYHKVDQEAEEDVETGVKLCEMSSDVFTCVMFSGLSASHSHQTSTSPTTPSSPETVPLTSASADHHSEEEAEEEKEEETTQTEPAAEEESDHSVDLTPVMDSEDFQLVFADVDDADETRL